LEKWNIPAGYAELAPGPDLAARVACFWTRRAPVSPAGHRVLPDGCVDFILTFGPRPLPRPEGSGPHPESQAIAVGAMTKPLVVREGPRLSIGVRFRPGQAFAAFGIPAAAATDALLELRDIEPESRELQDRLLALQSDQERLAGFVAFVRRRLAGASEVPPSVRAAVRHIERAAGNLRVADLPADTGVTRQQLARQFATHVGVSPKMLARVMRARAVLARADAARAAYPRPLNWSAIAQDLGYYDQAHLIDDFKALTGVTPGEWLGQERSSRPGQPLL